MSAVAVTFGGPSPEHDVSIVTGLQAARTLTADGWAVRGLYWSKGAEWFEVDPNLEARDFREGVPGRSKPLSLRLGTEPGFYERKRRLDVGVVVNCCHGGPGEDGTLQAAFDLAGIRYTGPTAAGAALGMDKLAFGATAATLGLRTLPRSLLRADGAIPAVDFPPPYIVKPRFGGSSIGIEVVEDLETAGTLAATSTHLRAGAVIEPYLPRSRDVNIAVRTHPAVELSAIEEPHRQVPGGEILTYEDKYLRGQGLAGAPRDLPARVPDEVAGAIRDAARVVAAAGLVLGVARLDFLLVDDEAVVNEINTIPGVLSAYLWVDPAIPFARLLADMVAEAAEGGARAFTTAGADGTLLRSATSIAAKLGL